MIQQGVATSSLRPEDELILCCARMGQELARITELLQADLDWPYLLRTARRHGLLPLLYSRLKSLGSDVVAKNSIDYLRKQFEHNTRCNVILTTELLELLNLFHAHGIAA